MRLVFIAMQAVGVGASDARLSTWVLFGGIWIALVLGPLAELLPITWQRAASTLRISQFLILVGVSIQFVADLAAIIR